LEKIKVVLDTNILLDNSDILNDTTTYDFVLPYVVLRELDKKKFDQNLNYPARTAIKKIWECVKDKSIQIVDLPTNFTTNDELIVKSAKDSGSSIITNDIGARVVAFAQDVPVLDFSVGTDWDKSYLGYVEFDVEHMYFAQTLIHNKSSFMYDEFIAEMALYMTQEDVLTHLEENQYLIIYPSIRYDEKYVLYRRRGDKVEPVSVSIKRVRDLGLPISFLHPEQAVAFNMIFDSETPLTVVQGKVGSGKSLMSIAGALARTRGIASRTNVLYNKVYVTRPPIPVDRNLAIGFLPGSMEAKMGNWLAGFLTNLKFLFEITEADVLNERANAVFEEFFSPINLESIQGASINGDILIVDESQLLSTTALKQVMSRIARGSKLILLLDPEQTYGANTGHEGYKKLLPNCKGNPLISFINLQHIQRSDLTKLVDKIFS
jgi:PhoH-like ATPase